MQALEGVKECQTCHLPKVDEEYPWNHRGNRAKTCKQCKTAQRKLREKIHPRVETYSSKPGSNEDLGDAIMSLNATNRSSAPRPYNLKSKPSGMAFHKSTFDPEKARMRGIGSI